MKKTDKRTPVYDCVALGISPTDYICLLDHYPGADEKTHCSHFIRQGGGPASTAMAALGRWGARAALISIAGRDDDGRFARAELERCGVDTRWFRLLKGARSACSFIWVDTSTGARTVVTDRTGVRPVTARDVRLADLPPARVFHTDGRDTEACLKAMRHYRAAGAQIVIDAGSPRPRMEDLAAACDHFVASHSFMRRFFGSRIKPENACRRIREMGPHTAVVTLGADGCVGQDAHGPFAVPGHRRENFIVDTTGAGDVFHGGYIYGLLQGWPAERCAAFGNAAAFLKCGKPGGRTGIPTVAAVERLMRRP